MLNIDEFAQHRRPSLLRESLGSSRRKHVWSFFAMRRYGIRAYILHVLWLLSIVPLQKGARAAIRAMSIRKGRPGVLQSEAKYLFPGSVDNVGWLYHGRDVALTSSYL